MKKAISLLLCLLLTAALAAPALADVIWEPEDEFYWQHSGECTEVRAEYEAQEDAAIQKTPKQQKDQGTVPAGGRAYVYYRWQDWGYTESAYGNGWIDLTRFRKLYSADDFSTDHSQEIFPDNGVVSWKENETILIWTFPGSGILDDRAEREAFDWAESGPVYSSVWTDEAGRRWGFVSYYYGDRGWICLDDPAAEDLTVAVPHYAEDDGDAPAPAAEPGESGRALLTVGLVAAAVAITAGAAILLVLKRKRSGGD